MYYVAISERIIYDYGISGNPLLTSIEVVDFEYGRTIESGAVTRIINKDGTIEIMLHDTPSAPLNYLATTDFTVKFEVADNITISEDDTGVKLESDEVPAYILATAPAGVTAPVVTISKQIITIDAPANSIVLLRAVPVTFGYDGAILTMNRNVARRMVNDQIGAELTIVARDGAYCVFDYANLTRMPLSYNNRTYFRILNSIEVYKELEEVEPTAVPNVTQMPTSTPFKPTATEPTATEPTTQDTPGFAAVAGVMGLIAAVIVKRRYRYSK